MERFELGYGNVRYLRSGGRVLLSLEDVQKTFAAKSLCDELRSTNDEELIDVRTLVCAARRSTEISERLIVQAFEAITL